MDWGKHKMHYSESFILAIIAFSFAIFFSIVGAEFSVDPVPFELLAVIFMGVSAFCAILGVVQIKAEDGRI